MAWTRPGGLPSRATDIDGVLTIRDVRPEDAGTYTCTGSNLQVTDSEEAQLVVSGTHYVISACDVINVCVCVCLV